MKFFFISEHYEPRIGGVTTYIRETCKALVRLGHEVTLAIPGEQKIDTIKNRDSFGFQILEFGTGTLLTKNISSEVRVKFSHDIGNFLSNKEQLNQYDVIHNLFGLYLMQYFDLAPIKKMGKPVGVTVHNIPPEECGTSWKGDNWLSYFNDIIRKEMVRVVNKRRIKKQLYDYYVVPSQVVKEKLSGYIKDRPIHAIGHGGELKDLSEKSSNGKLRFLTVAGFVPHKNQHFIPKVAQQLKAANIDFTWDVVGPNKNKRYVEYIQSAVKKLKVEESVKIHFSVPYPTLVEFYNNADIYIQLSSEEGFCITTLDAAFYGIPIIGTKAGAIPEIIENSRGLLVDTEVNAIFNGIKSYLEKEKNKFSEKEKKELIEKIASIYNWEESAKKMVSLYA